MEFRILGQLEVLDDGRPVELGTPRQRALLARLLVSRNETVSTDRLLEDLWLGDPPETARHTLHVYISRLRKALGREAGRLQHDGHGYRLAVGPDELDAGRFERLTTEGRAALGLGDAETAAALLRESLNVWRGAALADVADEAYGRDEAIRLEELRQGALEARLWADLELGRHGDVLEELRELVGRHPFRESFAEQLMLALYRCGRQAEALRVYQATRSSLAGELGIEPGPALRRLEERILAQDPSLETAPDRASGGGPRDLPLPRTSFVGRHGELAEGRRLALSSRLLTLTGAPGSGKTRLALRLAADQAEDYPHGTFFVPLAAIDDPRAWASAVAQALGLSELPGASALDGLKAFMRNRRLLLVLDNFEQIAQAGTEVGELLDSAPELTIMVTSRVPLGIAGEQRFPIPPLAVPPADAVPAPEELLEYDAVALFVARSRAADPGFELNEGNAAAVAGITVRLDGLPLAIELAAARTGLLTPQELQVRLDERLTLLTEGPADTDDRHRTMRDALSWSYALLDPGEQALLHRLGVFLGGFTLDAAVAVSELTETEVLDGLGALLSHSLLYRPVDVGQARFAMLEVTREFAREAAGAALRESAGRHARYFVRLAEEIEPLLTQEPSGAGARRLAPDVDNIRAALRFSVENGEPDLGLRLGGSIWRFWQSSGRLVEGREWLGRLVEHPKASNDARAKGLTALAGIAYWLADYDEAMARYEAVLDLYRRGGDRFDEADTLYGMSLTAGWMSDLDAAERLAGASRRIFEELGSREGVGRALMARAFVLWRRNDLGGARDLWEESLAIVRESGDLALASTQLVGLACITFHIGDRQEAMRIVLDGLREAGELENTHVIVWMLDFVAAFAAGSAPDAAVRLAGAVDLHRREAGGGIVPASLDVDDARTTAKRFLGRAELERAWAEGRRMSLEEAIDQAYRLGELVIADQETR